MDRVDKFEQRINKEKQFIKEPLSYIYDSIESPDTQELIECTRAIVAKNRLILVEKNEQLAKRKQKLESTKAIISQNSKTIPQLTESVSVPKTERSNQSEIIEFINYSKLDDETKKALATLTHKDIIRLKLYYYKQSLLFQKEIQHSIITNPTNSVLALQDKLSEIELIMEFLNELEETEVLEEQELNKEYSNIIFAPSTLSSTYFYEDIENYSEERLKEIKLAIDKLLDGYLLKTKDTKPLKGYNNLYEYKHPNGMRILYVVSGSIIVICSLFYKDKQKSIKITGKYNEAISRFNSCSTYILKNFTNPDFHIEQAELIGNLYSLLDNGISLQKKVGE